MRLIDQLATLPPNPQPDDVYTAFVEWAEAGGTTLYPHQDDATMSIVEGHHAIATTPTGSGKSMIALAAHFDALARKGVSFYTAPIKALVSEKFFALCEVFGAENVGMVTGDASVNPDAPIICCTAEILANIALREGDQADVTNVVMDEFHFVADPSRGWAWQVGVTELPQAQLILLSATLGDVTQLRADIARRTGIPCDLIDNAERPVPLAYRWAMTPIHDTIEEIVHAGQAPVYVVHSTQAAAIERAQALMGVNLITKEDKAAILDALGGFRFSGGFGQTLSKMVRVGIGVHHAGMLPRYRRLVETLAQKGLLKVICGTDTLGVGINVPIRTVLFTALTKFDGHRMRVLRSREFHQIAGRAGRAGYDTIGYVVAQAPEHVVENARMEAKAGDDPKKRKKLVKKKPPDGFITFTEETFTKLIGSTPETLHPRMKVSHAMLLNLVERETDPARGLVHLIEESVPDAGERKRLYRRAAALARSLVRAGVLARVPDATGHRRHELAVDLQDGFALNQPLSAFGIAALEVLDPESPTFALDVVSVIEATLEDPMQVLLQQQFLARGEAVAEMKADGYAYEERMEALDGVEWPKPLADVLEHTYGIYREGHPWLAEAPVSPKSIVRDMYERAMTFGEYVAYYKIQRVEGLLLRYLSDAYRALRHTVPERHVTEELDDLIEWLGETIRITDSSLVDEWEALTNPDLSAEDAVKAARHPGEKERPLTGNLRAFRIMVRNRMWRLVELAQRDDVDGLGAMTSGIEGGMTVDDWDDALGAYWDEHGTIGMGADARGPGLIMVVETGRAWKVRQILDDPDGNHDWQIQATVDLDASDEAGELVLCVERLVRID